MVVEIRKKLEVCGENNGTEETAVMIRTIKLGKKNGELWGCT